MVYCCVPRCDSNGGNSTNVPYFSFPKDENLMKQWVEAIPRANFIITPFTKICIRHFAEDSIIRGAQVKLKPTAVPVYFDNEKSKGKVEEKKSNNTITNEKERVSNTKKTTENNQASTNSDKKQSNSSKASNKKESPKIVIRSNIVLTPKAKTPEIVAEEIIPDDNSKSSMDPLEEIRKKLQINNFIPVIETLIDKKELQANFQLNQDICSKICKKFNITNDKEVYQLIKSRCLMFHRKKKREEVERKSALTKNKVLNVITALIADKELPSNYKLNKDTFSKICDRLNVKKDKRNLELVKIRCEQFKAEEIIPDVQMEPEEDNNQVHSTEHELITPNECPEEATQMEYIEEEPPVVQPEEIPPIEFSPSKIQADKIRNENFGKYIADEINELDPVMGSIAKKLINDVLFEAQMGRISLNTYICTEEVPSCNYTINRIE